MHSRIITVDFAKKAGKIKPLLCSSALPLSEYPHPYDLKEVYADMSVGTVRLTPRENLPIGVGDIFPDFSLDPRLEASYNFTVLDSAASMVKSLGMDIFLTLGERPDPTLSSPRNLPPRDKRKWAEICVGIIRHLNEGWANGFKYGIKLVEIWQGADTYASFRAEPEEYYELYSLVSKRLKERFPRLSVGGYSSKGFYSLNHAYGTEEERKSIDFLENFLDFQAKEKAPLDFLSWKCYAGFPEELPLHSNYAASYLSTAGFKKAKSIVTEFNAAPKSPTFFFDKSYPAFLASMLLGAQKSDVDMMFYSDLSPLSPSNGLYSLNDRAALHPYAALGVAAAFGELLRVGDAVDSGEDYRRELYALAAGGKDRGAVLISTADFNGRITVEFKNSPFTVCKIKGMTGGGERGVGASTVAEAVSVSSDRLNLKAGANQVYLITLE